MIEAIFDTNLVIDVEEKREGYKDIMSLLDLEKKGKVKILIPVIVASEKIIDRDKVKNFYDFKTHMKELGFENTELLKPICYLDMCYLDFSIFGNDKIIQLAKNIHKFLFPNIEFDHKEYCENRYLNPKKAMDEDWKNAIIDSLILWSTAYYKKKILVTRDTNFHKHKYKIKKELGIDVKYPKELLKEIKVN